MRALILALAAVATACGGSGPAPEAHHDGPRERLVLMELEGAGTAGADAAALTDNLCSELAAHPRYELVCPGDLRALLQVQSMERLLGCSAEDCVKQLGELARARQVVAGTVSRLGDTWSLSLRLLDTAGATVSRRADRKAEGPDAAALLPALAPLAKSLLE